MDETYRLRTFVTSLAERGELLEHAEPFDLGAVAGALDGEPAAVLFSDVGPTGQELVGNVMGSRHRLALALGVSDDQALAEVVRRVSRPGTLEIVDPDRAPVHEVVQLGDDVDLTTLPVNLQHEHDGGPFISAAYDVSRKAEPDAFNTGCRRLMIRGRRTTGVDLNAPSDLRNRYLQAVDRGERLPVAFVIGSHPLDYLGATMRGDQLDELCLISSLRGAPLSVTPCVSQDLLVPADAELVLEGYLDPAGFVEHEGPYGEYMGYYGGVKLNPVFHVTALTRRSDYLFQTVTISGAELRYTDTAQLASLATEVKVWETLLATVREPVAVYVTPSSGGISNVRFSLRQRYPGEARNALASIMGTSDVKNVMATDDDVDIFSDGQMDWALATRFQADRDLLVLSGLRTSPLDPSVTDVRAGGAKVGFDLTRPMTGAAQERRWSVPGPPELAEPNGGPTSAAAAADLLAAGPASYAELMRRAGDRDGRAVLGEIGAGLDSGTVELNRAGLWQLVEQPVTE